MVMVLMGVLLLGLALGAGLEDPFGFRLLGRGLFLRRLAAGQGSGAEGAAEGEDGETACPSRRA